ncbi:hypothetical protein E3G67_003562 [Mycobacteroides abscessus]|nr:hypothetical protein [Mycobacteroides abscessus]
MIPCAHCSRIVMRPMGGDVCGQCRRDPFEAKAYAIMIAVGLFIALVVAVQAGWL